MNVKNFLQLPITKDFTVVAGSNGLHKPVQNVEILDFEFSPDIHTVRETIFTPNSVILSSLLFAKQQPDYLVNAVKNLIQLEASALAYKPVIYNELPEEVLALANAHHFPILRFGGDEFFEKIILETMAYAKTQDYTFFLETIMKRLINEDVSAEQITSFLQQLNKPFEKYVFVANFQMQAVSNAQWMQSFLQLEPLLKTGVICKYKNSLFILMTNLSQHFQFEKFLNEWLTIYDISTDKLTVGYSQVHSTQTALHLAVREAFAARLMAEIDMTPTCHYTQLGSDSLLIELHRKDPQFAMHYVKNYLGPLLDEKVDTDFINTAITYIAKKGNIKEVAVAHFCHPNTIRYRMAKIRQLVAPLDNDYVFYERLSAAVKLYLLHSKIAE
ncbi:PucR family transcriptional regulator [Lysinibacillus mangiferihumi]|uniref:PucR family transcriptional regulator n=1 Tax=Lysinibacillus mangiferihumi TaxID=1130819 RepID=A0A4U2XYH6_9BACI|nr:PucR family transcriptional regulator [Lysinibacillus mangiferihumi]TKI52978.1 PucR family transcriptional regulator [Lysinibacillus mangiferihumi]